MERGRGESIRQTCEVMAKGEDGLKGERDVLHFLRVLVENDFIKHFP